VQKYWTITRHAYTALLLAINPKRFESLTPVQQEALQQAANAGREFQRKLNAQAEAGLLADLRSRGVQVLEGVDLQAFRSIATAQNATYLAQQFTK
jgi:TRAP-type C4-dicarboxylate transport system substrate-binding protein